LEGQPARYLRPIGSTRHLKEYSSSRGKTDVRTDRDGNREATPLALEGEVTMFWTIFLAVFCALAVFQMLQEDAVWEGLWWAVKLPFRLIAWAFQPMLRLGDYFLKIGVTRR